MAFRLPGDERPKRARVGALQSSSPDRAVYVDEMPIQVKHLLSGVVISQEERPAVTHDHVALDRHDVLPANVLPCAPLFVTGDALRPVRRRPTRAA